MSTFSGISTALSALQAHRRTMDVIGQNVANVNTPGYTRQRAELQEVVNAGSPSLYSTALPIGNGVTVTSTSRAFDPVVAQRVNVQTGEHALQQERAQTLSSLESLAQEPSSAGLATQLNKMWAAFADAATKAGSTSADGAARETVLGAAQNVVVALQAASRTIDDQWATTRTQMGADVDEVNTLAGNVAVLNGQIQKATATGGAVNELMDKRDQLVTRIVELTGATTQPSANGQTDLYLGGTLLVQGSIQSTLTVSATPYTLTDVLAGQATGATAAEVANGTILLQVGGSTLSPLSGGTIAAELEALRTTLPNATRGYDAVADSLARKVNKLQNSPTAADANGATSPPALFSGANASGSFTARSITITAGFTGKDLALATAGKGTKDGSNAAAIAALGTTAGNPLAADPVDRLDSPDRLWASYVARLGAASSSASARTDAAQAVLTASIADQQSSAGVSLDDESVDLIAAQRAYQGAARVMTAVDEMLDTLINKTGLVGR